MPIEFFTSGSEVRVRQSFESPTVYLDHWAVRKFSDDLSLQDQLVATLLTQRGTLLVSNISLAEFAREDDRRHVVAAESFLERLLPHIYLTDFAFDKLQEQESQERDNARRFWPPADLPQLKLFAERAQHAPLGFTMHGFMSLARDNRVTLEAATKQMVSMIRSGLNAARMDPSYVRAARNLRPTARRTRTFVIMAELLREFVLNPNLTLSDNDAIDLLHAAIPVNCCDFVLLDGAWTDRVWKLEERVRRASTVMPIAKCYSSRRNGVARFLGDLTAHRPARSLQ